MHNYGVLRTSLQRDWHQRPAKRRGDPAKGSIIINNWLRRIVAIASILGRYLLSRRGAENKVVDESTRDRSGALRVFNNNNSLVVHSVLVHCTPYSVRRTGWVRGSTSSFGLGSPFAPL